jgi:hypothetical protein
MESTSLPAQTRGEEIAALEASIARDRHTLEDLVAEPRKEEADVLHADAILREIVERITAETQRLEDLRDPSGQADPDR